MFHTTTTFMTLHIGHHNWPLSKSCHITVFVKYVTSIRFVNKVSQISFKKNHFSVTINIFLGFVKSGTRTTFSL